MGLQESLKLTPLKGNAHRVLVKIPAPKRKKATGKAKDSDSENAESIHAPSPTIENPAGYDIQQNNPAEFRNPLQNGMPATTLSNAQALQQATHNTHFAQFMKPKFARAPIKEAGRVAYLGESSNLSLLVHDRHGTTDVVHYPLPDTVKGSRARMTDLDNLEIDILHQRGAFLLPPRALCDELVESYFKWVAPVVPVINKTRFMHRYRDSKNPPSLLLLQAMLLAGSRVCTNPQLMDANGSTTPAAMTFYKRAKALYDANYEDDRVTIVQALVLMGWYWEGPEGNVEGSQLSRPDKRLWKRIWWTLFTRDRSVAVALGRPVHINTDDSDVEMVSEDDFIEDEDDQPSKYPPDSIHVQFFLQPDDKMLLTLLTVTWLSQIGYRTVLKRCIGRNLGTISGQHYFIQTISKNRHLYALEMELIEQCSTTLCLLHRAHMPPATYESSSHNGYPTDAAYPSRNIAFQAAGMITSIIDALIKHDELKFTPAFIVYSLFSALIMLVYQMRSSVPSIVTAAQERMQVCMNALKEVSKVWLVAKMVHTLFESILGNKMLEDRLQKAAGKKHKKPRLEAQPEKEDQPQKRKYDDMEIGFAKNGPPAPAMSYERSRPQTPAVTPSRELGQSAPVAPMAAPPTSPRLRQSNDAFLGGNGSRANTRPPTPFNPSFSVPATPPDLFLVTRDSPHISQSLWENFQPDQLFPGGTDMSLPPYSTQPNLDPQLQMPPMQHSTMLQPPTMPGHQQLSSRGIHSSHDGQAPMPNIQDVSGLPHIQGMQQSNTNHGWSTQYTGDGSPEDSWSNSSRSQAPVAPTTLNVEDWFQFFGMNGDMGGMSADPI
ncbi:MAG: hypothetical protein Q9195_005084 [Heterodermia aff. obscurata]